MIDGIKNHLNFGPLCLGCLLILISCAGLYSFGSQKPTLLKAIDNRIMSIMFKIRGPIPDSGEVLIVDIDEKSLKKLGQWPWPRNILADMTGKLHHSGARAIGFDIVFAEKDRTSPVYYFKNLDASVTGQIPEKVLTTLLNNKDLDYDLLFGQAVSMGSTVLGYAFQMTDDGLKSVGELPFPSGVMKIKPVGLNFNDLSLIPAYRAVINHPSVSMAESEGFFNVFTDDSGTTRQVPLLMVMDGIPYPSLALETFRVGMNISSLTINASRKIKTVKTPLIGIHIGDKYIPTDSYGRIFVNYRGPANTFRYVSALDVLTHPSLPIVKDKFVLVGSSSTGLFDLKVTPFSSATPGVEINATIIDNLIKTDPFIYDIYTEIGLTYTLIIAGGLLLSLILSSMGPLAGGMGAFIFFSGAVIWNYHHFFLNNRQIGIAYPIITCAGILILTSIFNSFRERKTKKYLQRAFSHYVAKDVVSELIKNPKSLSLKGEEKELTVLFCDIRGFTSLSENMDPKDLANFMNNYLTRMSRIVISHKGTVDKFIGDAIMAFWGAPKEDPDHAVKAVRAAMEVKSELKRLEQIYEKKKLPRISVGIGINSGLMSVGNFGSNERFDYTVMGDNVNLASRLEGANKNYGTTILISSATKEKVKDFIFCRFIDKVQVKGRQEPVDLYEPLLEGLPPDDILNEIQLFEKGIHAYHHRDFHEAHSIINTLFEKNPKQLYWSYLNRIEGFLKSPPPQHWEGVERRQQLPVNKLLTK